MFHPRESGPRAASFGERHFKNSVFEKKKPGEVTYPAKLKGSQFGSSDEILVCVCVSIFQGTPKMDWVSFRLSKFTKTPSLQKSPIPGINLSNLLTLKRIYRGRPVLNCGQHPDGRTLGQTTNSSRMRVSLVLGR